MTLLALFEPQNSVPIYRGAVQIDIDPAAERYAVFDRRNLTLVMTGVKPATGIIKIIVPFDFTVGFNLLALIVDDTGEPSYNIVGADKIQAELVDAKTVVLSP